MKNNELIYGIHTIENILENSPERILKLIVTSERKDDRIQKLIQMAKAQQLHIEFRDKKSLDNLLRGINHQGVMAECRPKKILTENDLSELLEGLTVPPLLLILDGVEDPHNLGACLRTADAAGVHAVIAPKDRAAGITPVVHKVAAGATESLAFIQVTNLARTMRDLKERGIWIYGFSDASSTTLFKANLTGPAALVLGAEGSGMRHLTEELCDEVYAIPMAGAVSSLNVSVATGVCLFEAVRQRHTG